MTSAELANAILNFQSRVDVNGPGLVTLIQQYRDAVLEEAAKAVRALKSVR